MRCPVHPGFDWPEIAAGETALDREQLKAVTECSFCLENFMQALEAGKDASPPGFASKVMQGLPSRDKQRWKNFQKIPLPKPVFHYLTAASVTMVLVHLGFFDILARLSAMMVEGGSYEFSFLETVRELLIGLFH